MPSEFYQVSGPWSGKLWIGARPRGGDWAEDEIRRWRSKGASAVISLLTPDEERDLDLQSEASIARDQGMAFLSIPVGDRDIPTSETDFAHAVEWLDEALAAGEIVVVHCRQGIGRSGMAAACVLILNGADPSVAIAQVSSARGLAVPETEAQREWIMRYAARLVRAS